MRWGALGIGSLALAALCVAGCDRPPAPPVLRVDAGPPPPPRADAGVLVACTRDADCAAGVCRGFADEPPFDRAPLLLACGAPEPGAAAPGAACRERRECDRQLCALAGACVIPCVDDDDCAPRQACREVWVETSRRTMQHAHACTQVLALPPGVEATGPTPGPSLTTTPSPVELDALAPTSLVVWRALDPLRQPELSAVDTRDDPPVRVFEWPRAHGSTPRWGLIPHNLGDVLALRYPNGPDTPTSPAGWTVLLASAEGSSASEQWLLHRAAAGATFDVDAYLAGGGYWESMDGALPADLAAAFDGVRALLEGTGLALGEVRVHDLRGYLRERFSVVESVGSNDFAELFRLSAGATRPSVHVFFVRYISGALGVASAIPGAQGMPGTGGSGVVVAVDATPDELLPVVVLHEIGHFAGLFHTTELDGSLLEPLTDTAVCTADRDTDRDGLLVAEECAGAGADNLMFWAGSGAGVTAQQVEILRGAMYAR